MDSNAPRTRRRSLTQKQLQEPESIELLALLQTVTQDGRILDDEIEALRDWLSCNTESTLPAVVYLRETVEAALEDGRVTAEERKWLQKAVEKVLPLEHREYAAMRRREVKADERREVAEGKERANEEAKKAKPIARFDFMVAGVLHDGRADIVRSHCRASEDVFLVREPDNQDSPNAILVRLTNGMDIGYVPETDAQYLAPLLDEGALQDGRIKKVLPGRQVPIPVVSGELYSSDSPALTVRTVTTAHASQIGPYKILRLLGEGGMGLVYEAEQRVKLKRRVALKVMKPGLITKEVLGRFELEREALAMMNHPGIAKVLDAGATDEGRPYFVMELVDGEGLKEYADGQKLSIENRVRLFIKVCRAVQHAHTKGVIHRDLKPSNILVTKHDGEALPKIIDFGVAKATGQRLTETTLVTSFGKALGTPAYMSPEQAEASGLDVDTRTDVYSLGVTLYELLVGRLPIDPDDLGFAGFMTQLMLKETDPPTPSTRYDTLDGDYKQAIAQFRRTDPKGLRSEIHGDLDLITMKAIDHHRERRYATANRFAMDLERYLNDEPVLAQSPSTRYRAAKFIRRHTGGVLMAATVAVLVIGSAVVVSVQAARFEKALARAEVARDFLQSPPVAFSGNAGSLREHQGEERAAWPESSVDGRYRVVELLEDWPGRESEVRQALEEIVLVNPDDSEALLHLVRIAGSMGDQQAVDSLIPRFLAVETDSVAALMGLGLFYEQTGPIDRARDQYLALLKDGQGSTAPLYRLVRTYLREDRTEAARVEVARVVAGHPTLDAHALLLKGDTYAWDGDFASALENYAEAERLAEASGDEQALAVAFEAAQAVQWVLDPSKGASHINGSIWTLLEMGQNLQAQNLIEAAERMYIRESHRLPPVDVHVLLYARGRLQELQAADAGAVQTYELLLADWGDVIGRLPILYDASERLTGLRSRDDLQ